ncbi:hypothetical protein E4U52_003420 [Claviceps spartinae]|nr:hypothetical protein E4U52_003420 [Claviceps spartinae]
MKCPAEQAWYALEDIPGKGKGLVATRNIPRGTRILCEEALFTIPNVTDVKEALRLICQQVAALSNEQRQGFLSMRNIYSFNHTEEQYFGEAQSHTQEAICLESCRINHDCKNNATYDWNINIKRNTVHAIRDINAGEEITASYLEFLKNRESRQRMLKDSYRFTCVCSLCSLSEEQSQERDWKIEQIVRLGELCFSTSPSQGLRYADAQTRLYNELYQEDCGHSDSYLYAVEIANSQGDLARGRIFAQRVVRSFVTILGSDNPETMECADIAKNPANYSKLYGSSMKWKTSVDDIPQGLGPDDFENWLWKREPLIAPTQPTSPPSQSLFSGFVDLAFTDGIGEGRSVQKRHSCFLGEIVGTQVPQPLDLKIRDIHGKIVELYFYTEGKGTELEPNQYQRGHTIAVLNASQYVFRFGPRGIRHTDPEMMKVNTVAEHGLFGINLPNYP